jgi:hypothetical protein
MCRWPALLALTLVTGCATTQFRGRVLDCQTQTPVEGADVQLASPETGASWNAVQTARDGSFAFDVPRDSKGAPLRLTAVKSGYRSAEKPYSSLPGTTQDVCIAPTLR